MTQSADIKVSIIVPVFNVEQYLSDCLNSILDQEFEHPHEVILVDDCSTDNSLKICKEFAEKYPRVFRLFANEINQGVSVSRNRGLELANGVYFMFIDPDDILPVNAVAHLYHAALRYQATIVKGNNSIFNEIKEKQAAYNVSATKIVEGNEVLATLYRHQFVRGHPWGKLFHRQKLGHLRFPAGVRMAQDLMFCSEAFSIASVLVLIDSNVYRYRLRVGGSTNTKIASKAYLHWFESVEFTNKFARVNNQKRAHKSLQVRTLAQFSRELKNAPFEQQEEAIKHINYYIGRWDVSFLSLIKQCPFDLKTILRFVKMKRALTKANCS